MTLRLPSPAVVCALLLVCGTAHALEPAGEGLYQLVRTQMEAGLNVRNVDPTVADFAAAFYNNKWETTREDVLLALDGNKSICAAKTNGREAMDPVSCETVIKGIQTIVAEEERVRTLGRDLVQMMAGQELAVSDLFGHPLSLPLDEAAILNIWKTGAGGLELDDGPVLRTRMLAEADISGPIEQLGGAFAALPAEEQLAVVRRYRHGVRLVQNLRAPKFPAPVADTQSGEGTERQYEFRDWPTIADALTALWEALPRDPNDYDPALSGNDVVLLEFPASLLDTALPKNLLVWAHVDADAEHPFSDAGLAFQMPLDTVAPSLISDPANATTPFILGGRNPPSIPDGVLCSHPLATRGFLCRDAAESGDPCDEPAGMNRSAISLVICEKGEESVSVSGPNVCKDIGWYDDIEKLTGTGGVCAPGNITTFHNTIGNNMCYIGSCAVKLFQLEEVTGRAPFLASDSGSPWFPVTPKRLPGSIVISPAPDVPVLPSYTPAVLLAQFDATLCALAGLPPRTPPVLCLNDEGRRLSLPLGDYASTMANFLQQQTASLQGVSATEDLGPATGREHGIVLLSSYLRRSLQEFSVMIGSATDLLTRIKSIPLPDQMCPMNTLDQ